MNFGTDFVPCIKLGVLSSPGFKLGVLEPPKPLRRSYVPGKEVYIFVVDAIPIVLQDLKYIHSCFFRGREMPTNLQITFGADFVPCTKLGGLSPPSFQVGGARAPAAPPAPTSLPPLIRSELNSIG